MIKFKPLLLGLSLTASGLFSLTPLNGVTMTMFGIGKTCVFSHVKARLTHDGLPLKGIKVIRRWEWQDAKEDSTTTDEEGYFEFPAVFESSMTRLLPIELVIAQGLYVFQNNEEKKIWSNSKRNSEENGEFMGHLFILSCELTNELKINKDYGSRMNTLCKLEK